MGDIGLSRHSILFVPRLVVERPLQRGVNRGRFAGSVADTLKEALKRARRPWESHSANDPLLFEDEADAVVTLIASWLVSTTERQWWPIVTRGLDPPTWWRRHLLRNPFVLPRVIARLTERHIVHSWLARLDTADVEVAIATIADSHGAAAPVRSKLPHALAWRGDRTGGDLLASILPEALESSAAPRARVLLAICLLAHRRPELISNETIGRAIAEVANAEPRVRQSRARTENLRLGRSALLKDDRGVGQAATERTVPQAPDTPSRTDGRAVISAPPIQLQQAPVEAMRRAAAQTLSVIETGYGGLLFLLNALITLEIYGDFTAPRRPALGLSPYSLLAMLGRAWFGPSFTSDRLYELLLEFGGSAGVAHVVPPRWSIPQFWLDPWPRVRHFAVRHDWLRPFLWHPAGFPIAELRPSDRRVFRRGQPHRRGDRHTRLPRQPRERWIAYLGLYLQARLRRTFEREDAVAFVCRQHATAEFDDDRLSARFTLADHALAIRIAGLDRDPGWIPSAGRIVEFAFE